MTRHTRAGAFGLLVLAAGCARSQGPAPTTTVLVPASSGGSLDEPAPPRGAGASPKRPSAASDREHAEQLFQEGRELMQKGQLEEACARFAESFELEHAVGTLLNLASCMERSGRVPRACELYTEARDLSKSGGRDDRARFADDRRAALGCP